MIFWEKSNQQCHTWLSVQEKLKISIEFWDMDVHVDLSHSYLVEWTSNLPLTLEDGLRLLCKNYIHVGQQWPTDQNQFTVFSLIAPEVCWWYWIPFFPWLLFLFKAYFLLFLPWYFFWVLGRAPPFGCSSSLFSSFALYLQRYIENHTNCLEQYSHYRRDIY